MRVRVRKRKRLILAALAALAVFSFLAGVAIGPVRIPVRESWALIWGGSNSPADGPRPTVALILREIRLPRVLLGFLVGAALALSGGVMQGLFRNPLASPYVLGIASGASAGAAAAIALGWVGPFRLPLGAFLGGALAVLVVYQLARRGGRSTGYSLILAGVALGAMFAALTGFLIFLTAGDRRLSEIVFWTMGGLGRARWDYIYFLAPLVVLGAAAVLAFARDLNALALGDDGAFHLGLRPERVRQLLLGLTTALTAGAVAFAGTIGFVGLITPHALRLLLGPDHRTLLPATALAGGTFLVWADAAARTAMSPAELPVGIITALLGAPFFLYLLRRYSRGGEFG